jgi:hypothetical protein
MHSTLMVFIDGIGIGEKDKEKNPFFKHNFKFLSEYFDDLPHLSNQVIWKENAVLFPIDPLMGVPNIPLSGTGQTSIFCGVNAQKILGQHFGPHPHPDLKPIIEKENIFKSFIELNLKATFVNAYPKPFFDYINSGRRRLSVTSLSALYAGLELRRYEELKNGNALSAEIDNSIWINKFSYDLELIKPGTAVDRLLSISANHHFTLFEYFLTDHLGHGRHRDQFDNWIKTLDSFLFDLLKKSENRENFTLIICSDHGNFEDISIKMHTLNPSLTIALGKNHNLFFDKIKNLSDIKETILGQYR